MFEIYFSVALYGSFVFRTDIFTSTPDADRAELVLKQAFSAAGYDVTRYSRAAAWTTTEVSTRG